jgi:hypothetical protein
MDDRTQASRPTADGAADERSGRTWWLLLLTPLLFVLAPLISFYATNAHELELAELLPTFGVGLLAAAAATAILFVFTRRVAVTVLLVSVFAGAFFYYGHAYGLLVGTKVDLGFVRLGPNRLLAVLLVLGVLPSLGFLARKPARALMAAKTLAVIGISLTLSAAVTAVASQMSPAPSEQAAEAKGPEVEPWEVPERTAESEPLPDIYFVVLDGYTSNSSLAEFAKYDNSPFTGYLESKGFYVAGDSKSNYSTTFMSLAATLNMEYVNDVIKTVEGRDRTILYGMTRKNRTIKTLKENGYTYTHIKSGWGATNKAPIADVVLEAGASELEAGIKDTTMFRPFADRSLTKKKHSAVLQAFSHLESIEQEEKPKFVFAHILVPHGPYVFKANGELGEGSSSDMSNWNRQQIDDYVEQLKATNAMTKRFVDDLIATHEGPLIVIIQGDHGTGFRSASPVNAAELRYQRRHSILNAIYFSEGQPEELYPGISPVNTFRVVLNEVLGTDYPLLEDKSFNSDSYDDPYDITDVTKILRSDTDE